VTAYFDVQMANGQIAHALNVTGQPQCPYPIIGRGLANTLIINTAEGAVQSYDVEAFSGNDEFQSISGTNMTLNVTSVTAPAVNYTDIGALVRYVRTSYDVHTLTHCSSPSLVPPTIKSVDQTT
jgi:hypothetical protein